MLTAPPRPYNPWHMLQVGNAMLPYVDRFPVFATAEEISWLKDTFRFQKEETGKLQRFLCMCCAVNNQFPVPVLETNNVDCLSWIIHVTSRCTLPVSSDWYVPWAATPNASYVVQA